MNVPEALRATERATGMFQKAVAAASEELEAEMRRIHSQLLEEQPVAVEETTSERRRRLLDDA